MDKAEGQRQHFEPANRILTDGNARVNRNARMVREDALRMLGLLCLVAIQIGIMVALPPRPVLGVIILGILLVLGVSFLADFLAAGPQAPSAALDDKRKYGWADRTGPDVQRRPIFAAQFGSHWPAINR